MSPAIGVRSSGALQSPLSFSAMGTSFASSGLNEINRRAGACPPPCCGSGNAREGQALALRFRGRLRGTGPRATIEHDATVGRGPVPRHAAIQGTFARDRPSRYGSGNANDSTVVRGPVPRRAGLNVREGQALALRFRDGDFLSAKRLRGTGPRATIQGFYMSTNFWHISFKKK